MKHLVFIMGSGRSGTTMIRDVLGMHPEVCVLPETSFYDRIWGARCFIGGMHNVTSRLRGLWLFFNACGDSLIEVFATQNPAVTTAVKQLSAGGDVMLFNAICEALAGTDQDTVVEKTPHHLLFMQFIAKRYPQARFIYVTRDPVDMVASYVSRGDLPANYKQVAMEWVVGNEVGLSCMQQFPDRVIHLRYEDVVEDPVVIFEKIFSFVGKSFDPAFLNVGSNSTFDKGVVTGVRKVGKRSHALPVEQASHIRSLTGFVANQVGYPSSESHQVGVSGFVFRLKYKLKFMMCLAGIRPMKVMLNKRAMRSMEAWVRQNIQGEARES